MERSYSGFDAALCSNTNNPADCQCNNVPDADYPNVLDNKKDAGGNLMAAWQTYWNVSGNMFPSSYPVRCQACGENVILPNGTRGDLPCAPQDEQWYVPSTTRRDTGDHPGGNRRVLDQHPLSGVPPGGAAPQR